MTTTEDPTGDAMSDGPDEPGEPGDRPDRNPFRGADRDLLVDIAALTGLALIALLGLHRVVDGLAWLRIGSVGILAGGLAAWWSSARRLDPLLTLVVFIGVFLLAGGIAVPGDAIAGALPGPRVPVAVIDGLVRSWKHLITTTPPVPVRDGIGVIPYLFGFTAAGFGLLLARRTEQPLAPAGPAAIAVVGSIVLGTEQPASILMQGGVFGIGALAWGSIRANRTRRSTDGVYWPRILAGAAMLALVSLVGTVLAGSLPFTDGARRVARDDIVPPFEPSSYASPLARYRNYKVDRAEEVLFRVSDLPDESRIRLAVMDRYDGVVWTVSGGDTTGSGRFEKVGNRIAAAPDGAESEVTITVEGYEDVWIPTVGALTGVRFGGGSAGDLERAFRYNHRTRAAASSLILGTGDRFEFEIRQPEPPSRDDLGDGSADSLALPPLPVEEGAAEAMMPILEFSSDILEKTETSTQHEWATALTDHLREDGFFANGGPDAPREQQAQSGHSLMRLTRMVETEGALVGDAEQYAALLGIMLRQLEIPARVVLGFRVDEGGGDTELTGDDLTAWVEVKFAGSDEWVPFDPTPDEDRVPEEQPKVKKKESDLTIQPPPPDRYVEPPAEIEPLASDRESADRASESRPAGLAPPAFIIAAARYGGPPVLLVLAGVSAILGTKWRRRRRRRTRGSPDGRANGAWLEMIDQLRDLGLRPHPHATRRELAHHSDVIELWPDGPGFAAAIDAAIFGADALDSDQVERLWERGAAERGGILDGLPRRRRIAAALSLASLRPVRPVDGPGPEPVPRIGDPFSAPASSPPTGSPAPTVPGQERRPHHVEGPPGPPSPGALPSGPPPRSDFPSGQEPR